jgi:hypothetical protein
MSTTNTNQSPLNWNISLAVWWSFMWRAVIYGMLLGALLGGIAGFFAGTPERGALFGAIVGYIGTIPASMLALKQALTKHLAALAVLVNVQQ